MRRPAAAPVSSHAVMVYATHLLGALAFLTVCEATRPARILTAADAHPPPAFEARFQTVAGRNGLPAARNALTSGPSPTEDPLVVTASAGGAELTD